MKCKHFLHAAILISCVACSLIRAEASDSMSDKLIRLLNTDDASLRYSTLMLLSHTVLSEHAYDALKAFVKKEKDSAIKLAGYYVLARRTQEQQFINAFVEFYPTGKHQREIETYHRMKSQYVSNESVSSSLLAYLAYLASTDDKALEKLISGYSVSNVSEEVNHYISNLYERNPRRVGPVLKQFHVDPETINRLYWPDGFLCQQFLGQMDIDASFSQAFTTDCF